MITNDAIAATYVIAAAFDLIRGIEPVLPVFGQGAKILRGGAPLEIGINAQTKENYEELTGTPGHPWQRRLASEAIFNFATLENWPVESRKSITMHR